MKVILSASADRDVVEFSVPSSSRGRSGFGLSKYSLMSNSNLYDLAQR